ncbi:palmitoyltransferase ZDHHC23-B [Neocloeon triangulifer]|uniref:palmitoyltransferase ZDHHC23-B n=1 Tax=Neocloeon triangulifer TaxID=2078957 RepID=UPI00286F1E66|nr:palmitoyltransferase ZDHHC23-B [Neocloeon triangulifer]
MKQYRIIEDNGEENNFLCFCEYVNLKRQRSHLLGCCCDCEHVDEYFDRKLTRQAQPNDIHLNMYRVLQDRCRIPWKGGARPVPLDFILPVFLLPLLGLFASLSVWCTVAVALIIPFLIFYSKKFYQQYFPLNKFFLSWSLTSAVCMFFVFELMIIPRLEILPSENFLLIVALATGLVFLVKTRLATVSVNQENDEKVSQKGCPIELMHCNICDHYVLGGEYHCYWLDCCIGSKNIRPFITGMFFISAALIINSYLVLTTACHPFMFYNFILVPDDCSDVYYDYNIAICFVSGVYSLILAIIIFAAFLRQIYLRALGYTNYEWSQLPSSEKSYICTKNRTKGKMQNMHV